MKRNSLAMILGRTMFGLAALFAATLACPNARAAPVNLVQNGDFTGTTLTSPGGYVCNQGSNTACGSRITSWTATCGANGCLGGGTPSSLLFPNTNGSAFNGGIGLYTAANAPLGGNAIADDGDSVYASAVSQTINGLTPGDTYSLTFYQAAGQQKGQAGVTTERWQVTLGTTQQSQVMNNASNGFVPWAKQTLTYTATLASETLTFLSQGTPAGEPPVVLLANVSLVDVTTVPEPDTLALLGMGLIGLVSARQGAVRRRRTLQTG